MEGEQLLLIRLLDNAAVATFATRNFCGMKIGTFSSGSINAFCAGLALQMHREPQAAISACAACTHIHMQDIPQENSATCPCSATVTHETSSSQPYTTVLKCDACPSLCGKDGIGFAPPKKERHSLTRMAASEKLFWQQSKKNPSPPDSP